MLEGLLVNLVPQREPWLERRVDWLNGPMGDWWGTDHLMTRAGHERWVRDWFHNDQQRPQRILFGVEAKDGTPIGTFSLFALSGPGRSAEIGAGIGEPDYWSGGFGSDAMLLIVEYAFRWLDLRRLWLTTMGSNLRAQRQVERCGFVREGARRSCVMTPEGAYVEFLYYGMLRDEWPGREVMVERLGMRAKAEARGYVTHS